MSLNDSSLQPVKFENASLKFQNKLQGLLHGLSNVPTKDI